ncbi:predicted protein [Nematostella vectensis]|uniref:Mutator-like transposase domain-containing protein n=1 Tax=Nematostella vectensis TaxID=45351 RepID=A7RUI6_NEMVE|nr:predicted protein [Nematostella vectensis]|eukprot:XP_001636974.1 predicted protein [Nematostella vectensis]
MRNSCDYRTTLRIPLVYEVQKFAERLVKVVYHDKMNVTGACFTFSARSWKELNFKVFKLTPPKHSKPKPTSINELLCSSCGWKTEFFTSKKQAKSYEVNRRLVYSMRSLGKGHSGAKRFCTLMNMPPPPTARAYSKNSKTISKHIKAIANETMKRAAIEIKDQKAASADDIVNCGVSCDGTWQKRGFCSKNGCVTVISMDNGKVLDTEALSQSCKQCQQHPNLDKESIAYKTWWAEHSFKCNANYHGSAPGMESEERSRIDAAAYFMRYSVGSYGWPMYVFMNPCCGPCSLCQKARCSACCYPANSLAHIIKDNCCMCNTAAIHLQTELRNEDLLYCSYHNKLYEIPFYVALDRDKKTVVVSIRGTLSMKDTLTDLTGHGEDIHIEGLDGGMAHKIITMVCKTKLYVDHEGTRTLDLLIRSQTPYPLGHVVTC